MPAAGVRSRIPRLGRYELLAELAAGGMATVYVARHVGVSGMERLVVVKRVHPHLLKKPRFREMFCDEARVAALIRHPNVIRLLDVLDDEGELLLVLEYVESMTLSALQRAVIAAGERLPMPVASRILADALLGLHAAHETKDTRGRPLDIVHRDVSPQNILVDVEGVSHLIDFGIAKAALRATETTSGALKGKLAYISPEQAKGAPLDRRSDVFSAGIVLYEALTGTRLFSEGEGDASNMILNILLDSVAAPSEIAPEIPLPLDQVVLKALERVREERFSTARELHAALVAACPPASPLEVAAVVERFGGALIRRQREEVLLILEGLAEPTVLLPNEARVPVLSSDSLREPDSAQGTRVVTVVDPRPAGRKSAFLAAIISVVIGGAAVWWRSEGRPATSPVSEGPFAGGAPGKGAMRTPPLELVEASAPQPSPTPLSSTSNAVDAEASSKPDVPPPLRPAKSHRPRVPTSASASSSLPLAAPSSTRADLHPENPY